MPDKFNNEWYSLLVDALKENSEKLNSMQDSYVDLKVAFEKHHVIDEQMHDEIRCFIDQANQRLDSYNRQLEIHIEGTNANRREIESFKGTVKPLLDQYVEDQVLRKARNEMIKKWSVSLGIVATTIAVITGIMKLLEFF